MTRAVGQGNEVVTVVVSSSTPSVLYYQSMFDAQMGAPITKFTGARSLGERQASDVDTS